MAGDLNEVKLEKIIRQLIGKKPKHAKILFKIAKKIRKEYNQEEYLEEKIAEKFDSIGFPTGSGGALMKTIRKANLKQLKNIALEIDAISGSVQ